MRKLVNYSTPCNKENKYDQITNLGIDIETQLTKSVLLPRIASKLADNQLRDYIAMRKIQEEKVIQNLRNEVDKLRKHVHHLESKKMTFDNRRTEENQSFDSYQYDNRKRPQVSQHVQNASLNLRTSDYQQTSRAQRNTDKNTTIIRRDSSYNKLLAKETEIEPQKAPVKKINRQQRQSKVIIPSNGSIMIEKQKPKPKKKKQRPINKVARRRLRKCIWAVYFSIFFPSLARKIYINRLKAFMLQYPHDVSKYYLDKKMPPSKIKQDQADLWVGLQDKLDIMKAIQQAKLDNVFKEVGGLKEVKVRFRMLLTQEPNASQQMITQPQSIQSQMFRPKMVEYLLPQFMKIITKLMESFVNLVKTTNIFQANWRSYSQGILDNSFINNSHPKLLTKLIQSGLVRQNLFKQILQVYDSDTQIVMLTFDIFCRIYCFNWFCKLKQNTQNYSDQKLAIGGFFLTLLYIIGQMMLQQKIKSYLKQKMNFQEKQKKRNKMIRPILALMVKRKIRNDVKDLNRLIYDPPFWKEVSTLILDNQQVADRVQMKIKNATTHLYIKLKQCLQQDLRQNKTKTLEEKYIITSDKQRPQNLQKYDNIGRQNSNKLSQPVLGHGKSNSSKIKMNIKANRQRDAR